ncbi:MAG: thioredoxin domain-containing protein [Bryobacteraceae bacterium]
MTFSRLALIAGTALLVALAQAPAPARKPAPAKTDHKSALDKPTLEAYVRHLLLWNPQVQISVGDPEPAPIRGFKKITVTGTYQKSSLDEVLYVSDDGRKIVRGAIYDITLSPFDEQVKKLKTDLSPSLGTPGAKVVIVVFTDYQCPHCREEAKSLRDNLVKTYPSDIRLYLKEFPLEAIHPWARAAAIAGRCVYRQDAQTFWDYHDFVFGAQDSITVDNLKTKVLEWAATKGLDTIQLGACIDTKATDADVNHVMAEARALGVNQTPSIFINGRPLAGNIPWETLKYYIDAELDYAKKTGAEAEECCQVSLPGPPGAAVKK